MHVAATSPGQGQGLTLVEDEVLMSVLFRQENDHETPFRNIRGLFHVQTFSSVRVVLLVRNLVFVGVLHKI